MTEHEGEHATDDAEKPGRYPAGDETDTDQGQPVMDPHDEDPAADADAADKTAGGDDWKEKDMRTDHVDEEVTKRRPEEGAEGHPNTQEQPEEYGDAEGQKGPEDPEGTPGSPTHP